MVAIDPLHRLLRLVGKRHLRNERISDGSGQLRVILRTPDWEDFGHLAFREIRHYGAENVQIALRLRAMGENLVPTLPEHRHPALRQELDLLDRVLEKLYAFPEDLAACAYCGFTRLGRCFRNESMNLTPTSWQGG